MQKEEMQLLFFLYKHFEKNVFLSKKNLNKYVSEGKSVDANSKQTTIIASSKLY